MYVYTYLSVWIHVRVQVDMHVCIHVCDGQTTTLTVVLQESSILLVEIGPLELVDK